MKPAPPCYAQEPVRKLIRDLTGQTGLKQRRAQIRRGARRSGVAAERARVFVRRLGRPLLVNAALWGVMIAAGVVGLSFAMARPAAHLAAGGKAVTRIRNIAEHALIPIDGDPLGVARTT